MGLRTRLFGTVRRQLSISFLAFYIVGTVINSVLLIYLSRKPSDSVLQTLDAGIAPAIAAELQPLFDRGEPFDRVLKDAALIQAIHPAIAVYIVSWTGEIAFNLSTYNTTPSRVIPVEPIRAFIEAPFDAYPLYNVDPESGVLQVFSAAPLELEHQQYYVYAVINGSDAVERAQGVSRENRELLHGALMFVFALACTSAVGLAAVAMHSARFERLTATVRAYRDGKFERRLLVTKPDEIDQLAAAVNEMADTIERNIGELEQRDELRRELIANISHDLRGPLTRVRLVVDKLRGTLAGDLNRSQIEESCGSIAASASLLERLLAELLELSRLEATSELAEMLPTCIAEVIEELGLTFRPAAEAKKLQLTTDVDEDLPIVLCDPGLIARAVSNLIENAVRYTDSGGRVVIRAERGEGTVRVSVSDSGVGIGPQELPRLFDRFYRGGDHRPVLGDSTGLGLAIVKRIVELHSSSVTVASVPQEGTTFAFELAVA